MIKLRERIAQIGPNSDGSAIAGERRAVTPDRVQMSFHRCEHNAARTAQIYVLGIQRDCVAQQCLSLRELSFVMEFGRGVERLLRTKGRSSEVRHATHFHASRAKGEEVSFVDFGWGMPRCGQQDSANSERVESTAAPKADPIKPA